MHRSNLRGVYASVSLANLAWDENQERAIDRIAASGKAAKLGVSLWKAKYMLEVRCYHDAHELLLVLYRRRYRRDDDVTANAMVEQALVEYISPHCRRCLGKGELVADEVLVMCDVCAGSRMHRYGDAERARRMRLSYSVTRASGHKLVWLHDLIGDEDRKVNERLNVELERASA